MKFSYEFSNSPVMRELERQEIAKNGTGEKPIEKKAEAAPKDILSKLIRFSKQLRKSGRVAEAAGLDEKIALYVSAEETGDDLINFAHPDGDVEIAPAKEGLGHVETQVSQHKKIVDVIQGKGATAGLLNDLAGILKVGQDVSLIDEFNSDLRLVRQQMAARKSTPPVFKFNSKALDVSGAIITGIIFDNIGGGYKDVVIRGKDVAPIDPRMFFGRYAYEWKVAWPGLYQLIRSWGGGLSDVDLKAAGSAEFYNAHVNIINDSGNKFTKILEDSINSLPKEYLPANVNESQIDSILNTLNQLRGPAGWNIFYIGHELQGEIKKKIENMISILSRVKTNLINEKTEKIKTLSVELFNLQKKIKPNTTFKKINTIEDARVAYNMPKASADDIIQSLMTWIGQWQKAGRFTGKVKMAQEAGGPQGTTPVPAPVMAPTAPATKPVAQKKRSLTVDEWRQENNKWKASVLPAYSQNVETMQRTLHNLITNAVPAVARKSGKTIDPSLVAKLGQTAREGFADTADFDGKWGKATAGALDAAKKILSLIDKKADGIDTGLPNGYLVYAGSDKEKQAKVATIAKANVDLINNILYNAGIKTTVGNNVSSSTEYDKIPVNVPLFSEGWYTAKDDMGAPLTAADLTDLLSFERWFSVNFSNIINQAVSFENWKAVLGNFLNRAKLLLQSSSEADVQDADDGTLKSYVDALTRLIGRVVDGFRELGRTTGNQTAASASALESAIKGTSAAKELDKAAPSGQQGQLGEGYDIQRQQRENLVYPPFGSVINVRKLAANRIYAGAFDIPIKSLKSGTSLGKSLLQILNPSISIQDISKGWSNPVQTPIFRYDVASWVEKIRFIGEDPNRMIRTPQGDMPLVNLENTAPANSIIDKRFRVGLLMVALPQLKIALNQIMNKWNDFGSGYEWEGKEASVQSAQDNFSAWSRTIDSLVDYANEQLRQLYSGK